MRFIIALILLLPSVVGFAIEPAGIGVFQSGPLGYGQAYIDHKPMAFEFLVDSDKKNGREDTSLSDLTGFTNRTYLATGGYLAINEGFHLLFSADVTKVEKEYNTTNDIYKFSSANTSYSVEGGFHFDSGVLQYGSKIHINFLGQENRIIDDLDGRVEYEYPDIQIPTLKGWVALRGDKASLGLTVHAHNHDQVTPKVDGLTTAAPLKLNRSIPGEGWLDLKMEHSESMTLAFSLHVEKSSQSSELLGQYTNSFDRVDQNERFSRDKYELLVGNEYEATEYMFLYSSLTYIWDSYQHRDRASVFAENTGGIRFQSMLKLDRTGDQYLFGISYLSARKAEGVVIPDSASHPWGASGDKIETSVSGWAVKFSWNSYL